MLRRLEALEKERSSSEAALRNIWTVVLGYHLGNLTTDEDESDLPDALAEALKYECRVDYLVAVAKFVNHGDLEWLHRYNDAYRRLFAKIELDFDSTPRDVLFEGLVAMVDQLPDEWLNWLRSSFRQWAPHAEIAVGSNLPRWLSGNNAFPFAFGGEAMCHKNSSRKR